MSKGLNTVREKGKTLLRERFTQRLLKRREDQTRVLVYMLHRKGVPLLSDIR